MRVPIIRSAIVCASLLLGGCFSSNTNVSDYVQRAQSFVDAGDLAKASVELENALKRSPANAQVNAMLGKIQDDQGNLQSAINHYLAATAADPRLIQAQLRLVELMIDTDHLREALARANTTLGAFPKSADALALRSDVEQRQGSAAAAQADSAAALAIDPKNARALAVTAMSRVMAGDPQAALTYVDRGLTAHADDVRLLEVRAAIFLTLKDPGKAADTLQTIVRAEPSNVIAQIALAQAQTQAGHADEALASLRRAVSADPNNQRMQMALVGFLEQQGHSADVITELKDLIAHNKDASIYDRTLAEYYRNKDQLPQAEETLRNALERLGSTPAGRDVGVALAKTAILRNALDVAKQRTEDVLAADPNNADALMTSAFIAGKNGRVADAIKTLLKVVGLNPLNGQAFQMLAGNYMAAGQPGLAVDAMQRAAAVLPGDIDLQLRLAAMMQASGRRSAENELLTRLTLQLPNKPGPWLAVGELAVDRKDYPTVERCLARLRALPGTEAAASRLAGDLQFARGDYRGAVTQYETAIASLPQPDTGLLVAFTKAANQSGEQKEAAAFLEGRAAGFPSDATILWIATMNLWADAKAFDKADAAFQKAASASSTDVSPYETYVGILIEQKRFDQARAILADAAKKGVPRWSLLLMQGSIAESQGDKAAAAASYKEASDLNPGSSRAANNYASLLADLEPKNKPALEAARERLAGLETSSDPLVVDTVAWLDYRLGRVDEATTMLTRIKAGDSQNPQLRFHMAAVLLATGDKSKGLALLDSVKGLQFPGSDEANTLSPS